MEVKKTSIMFDEICRLCLVERGYRDIFKEDNLAADIFRCTDVKVSHTDSLPQRICKTCLDIINKAIDLGQRAKRNEHHLKTLFGDDDDKSKETTKNSEDVMESVRSTHFEKGCNPSQEQNSVVQKLVRKVREDFFGSPKAKVPNVKAEDCQPDSSKSMSQARYKIQNGVGAYDVCETVLVIEDVAGSSLSQPDSSEQSKQSSLKRKHDDSKTNVCEICSKTFDTYKKLYLHNRHHNKSYVCPIDVCGKKFPTNGDMQKHIRTHTGEKPFACDLCKKRFAQRGTLRIHKETIHGDENV